MLRENAPSIALQSAPLIALQSALKMHQKMHSKCTQNALKMHLKSTTVIALQNALKNARKLHFFIALSRFRVQVFFALFFCTFRDSEIVQNRCKIIALKVHFTCTQTALQLHQKSILTALFSHFFFALWNSLESFFFFFFKFYFK